MIKPTQLASISVKAENTEVKEESMRPKMNINYILYMVDRYGSRTREVLMDYGRSSKEIQSAFNAAIQEGYLEKGSNPQKPYLTQEGRDHLREYYGNGIENYD